MARHTHTLACLVVLLALTSSEKTQSRWSRQISSYTADISDWVPLAGPVQREPLPPKITTPIKRQAIAEPRILTEPFPGFARPTGFGQDTFPSRTYFNSPANRQLYLQSVPSAPQNYLTDQGFGQSLRFGLSQPNYPLNQGFAAPQYTFENAPAVKQRPLQPPANPIKFENYPKQSIAPVPQTKPFINQAPKLKPEEPKFIEENNSKKKAQSLQKLKFDSFEKIPKTEPIQPKPKAPKEEVHLLYVPLEQLNRGQFNFRGPMASPQIINSDLYSQGLPKVEPLKQSFASDFQRPLAKPIENFGSGQDYFGSFDALKEYDQVPKFSTLTSPFPTAAPTTPKPKKLKPHQPPLAIFQEAKRTGQNKVGDVLTTLKNANSIAVLDTVNPLNAPKVFIGPSSLTPPEGFVKFELPYLSNIENSDQKLKQLPFFVAPLSYNTPNGFAKIPFPSPHVGSVVINSLIKETPSLHHTQQTYSTPPAYSTPSLNSYKEQPLYKQEQKPVTQKPTFNYYSTMSPKTNAPLNQQSNYYSLEPQTVTSLSPYNQPESHPVNQPPLHKGSYFLSNVNGEQYNPSQYVNFPAQNEYRNPEPVKQYPAPKLETTTTTKTTTTTTTPKPSTYSSQLLETHNPYSINQAFHFSTPLDYHSYFDEFKETYAPPGVNLEVPKSSTVPVSSTPSSTKPQDIVTEKPRQPTSPNYVQNYSPEIQYESEVQGNRYSVYNNDYTRQPEIPARAVSAENIQTINQTPDPQYIENVESQASYENLTETIINKITGPSSDIDNSKGYEQYETSYNSNEYSSSTTSSTTTTTTTRRPPTRTRGRPRYTTAKPDTNEATHSTTRATYTRKPLRERRPLPPRSRYEPNKVSYEKTTKKSVDSNESTTKSSRTRTRGRIQYKPSENDEYYDKGNKGHNSKEGDLAYQRDILHQNYPVTLMERASTADIEAITEPSQPGISSTKTLETAPDNYDSENAYAHESAAVSHLGNSEVRDEIPNYTSRIETQYENISVPKYSTKNEEFYQSRSSAAPTQSFTNHEESMEKQEDFPRHTTPVQRIEKPDISSYATESSSINTEQPSYSINIEQNPEDVTTNQDTEISKIDSQEGNVEGQPEENVVQTTPSYNRVRVRPGVIRQYHQASSTESSKIKSDRRRPIQAFTYRPAFDKRRTTMRIDEIEADLKTKQVHSRPEVQDYRHPVYKPDPSTESTTASSTQETTKRGHFRRRRPTYTTTSTETASTKKIYEVKNRFRGRRPTTEKPTDKPDVQVETTSTTVRNTPYNRYSHRPRLSERYNKKPEPEQDETVDQDSNYSINRPKYVAPETDQWSPKITSESFKPFNPNDIIDETKLATTERRSDIIEDGESDIITARNDYDDILISVTPATNTRSVKKIPDIPPTLEALVEQSKTTKSDSTDNMSTFETMLEEVMKSLEEQDKDEYTSNVMKHKGGEIGEIPPEKVIPSDDEYASKLTTAIDQETTTADPAAQDSTTVNEELHQKGPKGRRRGFWKKVKVRPVNTESIEVAESQYYPNTVNRLGESVKKSVHDKSEKEEKPRISVTTYKPTFQFIKDMLKADDESSAEADEIVDIDIPKIEKQTQKGNSENTQEVKQTTKLIEKEITTEKPTSVGDVDLGTGSPDPTLIDNMYYSTPTEPSASEGMFGMLKKADGFSLMDYLFGTTSSDSNSDVENKNETVKDESKRSTIVENIEITTEQLKPKIVTTESSYIPEEITSVPTEEYVGEGIAEFEDIKKVVEDEKVKETEATEPPVTNVVTSESSFMNPSNVVSTSMSTEISHETEICFRGKCIKTSKDIL